MLQTTDGCGSNVGTPKWLALLNGKKDQNLRSISWWFNFDVTSRSAVVLILVNPPTRTVGRHPRRNLTSPPPGFSKQKAPSAAREQLRVEALSKQSGTGGAEALAMGMGQHPNRLAPGFHIHQLNHKNRKPKMGGAHVGMGQIDENGW